MSKKDLADRVPELDGVRGLAIIFVLVFHIFTDYPKHFDIPVYSIIARVANMGWSGVDIFFVLSGFLITSILLRTKNDPGYFKKFYGRRILRIFPLYYVTITFLFIAMPWLDPAKAASTQALWPWYYTYVQNWGNAFNLIPTSAYLGPAWSLAIEEQFYLFWPAAAYYLKPKKLAIFSIGMVLASIALRFGIIWKARKLIDYNKFFYFSTITQLEPLIIGALIALAFQTDWWTKLLKRIAAPTLILGIGLIAFFAWQKPDSPLVDNYPMYMYGYSVIAISTAMLIVLVSTLSQNNILRIIFRSKIMLFFGKYSYAIYLFNKPIIQQYIRLFENNHWESFFAWVIYFLLCLGTCLLFALLSWNLLEKRMLALKKYFEYKPAEG